MILVCLAASPYRARMFKSSFEAAMCYLPRAELGEPCPDSVSHPCVGVPQELSLLLWWLS
jgi:hypothetical protein